MFQVQNKMDNYIEKHKEYFKIYEKCWGENMKFFPQYKYFSRPLYKKLGGNRTPLFSVPATFFITDYVIHQQLTRLILNTGRIKMASLKPHMVQSTCWTSLSIPIAVYKKNINETK